MKQKKDKTILSKKEKDNLAAEILAENEQRLAYYDCEFDPVSGLNAPPDRFEFSIEEVHWYLPNSMRDIKVIKELLRLGSIKRMCQEWQLKGHERDILWQLTAERFKHDFCFWAATCATIKNKHGGGDIRFVLNWPQRKTLAELERMRLNEEPIRMIILKARQWGGSTLIQIYMAWIQLVHKENWNSAIVAHLNNASLNIRAMYKRLIEKYPPRALGLASRSPLSLSPFNTSRVDYTVTQNRKRVRETVISVGSMQSPDTIRSMDVALAHFSEVGLWKKTEGRSPEDTVQAVTAAVLKEPLTMVVMESTAKGEHNLFHHEWLDAKKGLSDKTPVFVAWYEIDLYRKPFESEQERVKFVLDLIKHRLHERAKSTREEPGAYLWKLWTMGATLEGINWYISQRRSYRSHDVMASEFPSDDVEAFASTGQPIFDHYKVELLRDTCRLPSAIGDIHGKDIVGPEALRGLHFVEDSLGELKIWEMPDTSFRHKNRYVVAVDVGGVSQRSDFSVILVLDRWPRTEGRGDEVVAEWHGHIQHDLLAWKMAQVAAFYCNALLVVESNTFETRDPATEGEHTPFILDQLGNAYRNMYTRVASPENIRQGRGRKWGFQTNTHTKALVIDNLIAIINNSLYTEREIDALEEYNVFQRDERGGMNAAEGSHDDRLMARAIALYVSMNMPMPTVYDPNRFKSRSGSRRSRVRNESFF